MEIKRILIFLLLTIALTGYPQTNRESRMASMHFADMDYEQSFKDYSKLARFENSSDLYTLAYHYHCGKGTSVDIEKAIEYYRMAADRGDKDSQCELVCLYDDDEPTNAQQMADLYRYSLMYGTNLDLSSSFSSETDQAHFALYKCYKNGWGTEQNPVLADMWLAYAVHNECSEAQEEFDELYGIDEDIDEVVYTVEVYKHLYESFASYIGYDDSIESRFCSVYYWLVSGRTEEILKLMEELESLYEDQRIPLSGKAFLFSIIQPIIPYYPEFEKYKNDSERYHSVSETEMSEWFHEQLTKMMWRMDLKIRNKNISLSQSEMVDLGLPSGTLWASHNLGASDISDIGELYAWGECKPRKKFTDKNYSPLGTPILWKEDKCPLSLKNVDWQVPSWYDWRELFKYCEAVADYSNRCLRMLSPNGNYIDLPMTDVDKIEAEYWTKNSSSYVYEATEGDAVGTGFNLLPDWGFVRIDRWRGLPIRPVKKLSSFK